MSYNKKDGRKYKIFGYKGNKEIFVIYTSMRNGVFEYTMTEDYVLENFPNEECRSNDVNNTNYFVKYEGLGELIYGYLYKFGAEDYVDSIECVHHGNKLEVTINLDKDKDYILRNYWSEKDATRFFGYFTCNGDFDSYWAINNDGTPKIYLNLTIYSLDGKLKEMKSARKSLKERDDTIFSKDVKHWMLSGNDINITFKDGNELVGAIYEHRKDSEDKKAECFLCEDLTADYKGYYFIVEVYNGKISEIKFQSYDWLEHYMDDSYDLMESKKSTKKSLKEKVTVSKSLKIIERALLDLIHDDTIQEEFNMAFDDVDGIYDSVDDMFEVSVHNVLNKLLKEHTITVLPF
jgi:hypothetical protein